MFNEVKKFFENLNDNNDAKEEMKRYDRSLHFLVDGADEFWLNIVGGKCEVGKKPVEGLETVTYFTDADLMRRLVTAKIRFTDAYTYPTDRSRKGVLMVEERPGVGNNLGGKLVAWTGKLVRMAQEIR